MGIFIGQQRLGYLWEKIKSIFATKAEIAAIPTARIYMGSCSTAAATNPKVCAVEDFPLDTEGKPLVGTLISVKFSATNTSKSTTPELNVNDTGAIRIWYNNAVLATAKSAYAGYANRYINYMYDGTYWVFLGHSTDNNTTYSALTQAKIDAGTETTGRLISADLLRDNFYTESEVDGLLGSKANSNDLATVATSGSYNDLDDTPTIPMVPTNVSAFNNDAGYITSYTESDPTVPSHVKGITTTDISNWNGKQAAIADLSDIRNGAALGATALQSYTETDPTVPAWAKAANKPSYTAAEVGALPDSTTIPTKVSDLTNDSGFTSNTGTITGITMNGVSKGTSGVVNLGTVLTAHQDISGKANSTDVYTKAETDTMLEGMVICTDDDGSATTASFDAQADTVWHKAQVLSAAQQAQARTNIGAGTVSSVTVNGTTYTPTNGDVNLGTISGSGSVTVDTALSTTSTNPVQNKVIAAAIGDIETLLASI